MTPESLDERFLDQMAALDAAGFAEVARLRPEHNQRWKTFWRAASPGGSLRFIKCFHGYAPEVNRLSGEKEARLCDLWTSVFARNADVHIPFLDRHWAGRSGEYFVAMEYVEHEEQSVVAWMASADKAAKLCDFLSVLAGVDAPDWWTADYVLWALDGRHYGDIDELDRGSAEHLSPFGWDLAGNLGLDAEGRVVFKDYTYVRWEPRWLQNVHAAVSLLLGSVRWAALPLREPSAVQKLLRPVPGPELRHNMRLASQVCAIWAKKHGLWSWRVRSRLAAIRRLCTLASHMGLVGGGVASAAVPPDGGLG